MAYTTIDDPSEYFQTVLYTGNGGTKVVTFDGNSDLQPDWIWGSLRDEDGAARFVFDSSRGTTKRLKTDANTEEQTRSGVTAFSSNGFTMGSHADSNLNNKNLVVWAWKANGGTTTSVSASGSGASQIIASTHQANTTAGFSIVTFTAPSIGAGNDYTISHGLGAVPDMIITRSRSDATNWHVYHQATGRLGGTFLNLTNAFTDAEYFGDTDPTSAVFSHSEGAALDAGMTAIAYCFAEVKGYSKFGSYEGNGNADGTFVYLGFKPAWFMCKSIDTASSDQGWNIFDTKRDVVSNHQLLANDTGTEVTTDRLDILSNGVKMRNSGSQTNSAQTYIYMAFAEHPFVSSKGAPITAR